MALDDAGNRTDLAVASSDGLGFLSFETDAALTEGRTLRVVFPGDAELPVRARADGSAAGATDFVARLDPGLVRPGTPASAATYAPRRTQWSASPRSYARVPGLSLGQGHCEVPVPSTVTPVEIGFYQIIRRPQPQAPKPVQAEPRPLDLLNPAGKAPAAQLLFGQRIIYRQTWTLVGQSLGDLAYSLPLAPLESTNIAVIDWSRRDEAARVESTVASEHLTHDLKRDRSIYETVDVAVSEYQGGFAVLGGVGGAAPGVAGGVGAGTSHSWGTRDLSGESTQELADYISQASDVVRAQNSTVVVQATQSERDVIQTRTISNYNQTRAMTVQYYEVLRHFVVRTSFVEAQPVLLVPYRLVYFDLATAKRFRHLLVGQVLEQRVAAWFDSLDHEDSAPAPAPGGDGSGAEDAEPQFLAARFQIDLETGDQETVGYVQIELGTRNGTWLLAADVPARAFGSEVVLQKDARHTINVSEGDAIGVDLREFEQVRVSWSQNGFPDGWKFRGITVSYAIEGTPGLQATPMFSARADNALRHFTGAGRKSWTSGLFSVQLPSTEADAMAGAGGAAAAAPVHNRPAALAALDSVAALDGSLRTAVLQFRTGILGGSSTGSGTGSSGHRRKKELLLEHLNANRFHYSRCVWLGQDPDERIAMLTSDPWLRSEGVLDDVDLVPVGVSGSHVAFRYLGRDVFGKLPDEETERRDDERIVSLPSRGVFAEIHLSHCSAREERDPSRMYGPGEVLEPLAPTITGIAPGSRNAPLDTAPTPLAAPVVNIQNAPAAPDPTGLGAALDVIGRGDLFRDMSTASEVSGLLGGIISGALTGDAAKQAARGVAASIAGGTGGGGGRPHPARGGTSRDLHDRLQLLEGADLPAAEKARIQRNLIDPGPAPIASNDGTVQAGFFGGGGGRLARESRVIKEGDGVPEAVVFYLQNPVFDQPVQNRFGQILTMSTGDFFGERLILWPRASDIWYLEGDRILSDRPDQFFSLLEFEAVLDKIDKLGWLRTMAEVEAEFLIAFTCPLWAIVLARGAGILAHLAEPVVRDAIVDHGPKLWAGLAYLATSAPDCLGCIVANAAVEAVRAVPRSIDARDLAYFVGRLLFAGRGAVTKDTVAVALTPLREIGKAMAITGAIVAALRAAPAGAAGAAQGALDLLGRLRTDGVPTEGDPVCLQACLEVLLTDPNAEAELIGLASAVEGFTPALETLLQLALDPLSGTEL